MEKTNHRLIKVIITLTAIFMALTSQAQDRMTAILQHGDAPQAFYGADAFKEAMTTAQAGDVISLSTGTFNQTTIDKAVKIQGTGESTRITGDFDISVKDTQMELTIEGISFLNTMKTRDILCGSKIKKCTITKVNVNNDLNNLHITQCKIGDFSFGGRNLNNVYLGNCIINGQITTIKFASGLLFENCVIANIYQHASSGYTQSVYGGYFNNCIIRNGCSNGSGLSYSNTIIPSDGTKPSENAIFENIIYLTKAEITALFKDTNKYEMTEDAAAKYLGSDGTQVGAYGGANPFTLIPAIPSITSAKIDSKVKEDGKLSISITAETNN